MINDLVQISTANRINRLENLVDGKTVVKGDFEGSVTAYWVKLGDSGEGIVNYNDKEYSTKVIGFFSIPKGTEVELSYAGGIYYSKF